MNSDIQDAAAVILMKQRTHQFFTLVPTFLMRFYLVYSLVNIMIHLSGYYFSDARKIGITVSVCHPQHLSSRWQLTGYRNSTDG